MAIFLTEKNKVVVQGITGYQGTFHTKKMSAYGTTIVAGVTPGKAGTELDGIPIYDSIKDAIKAMVTTIGI